MNYTAHIRDNATGEVRESRGDDLADDITVYLWTEGNWACDCNRELFFRCAAGLEPGDTKCGTGAYSVRLVSDTGETLLDEMTPA